MTHPLDPDRPSPDPDSGDRSLWRRAATVAVITGSLVFAGAGAVLLGARYFVYERLAPIVESAISDPINRPLELGDVTRFTPTGITFDGARIPATDSQTDYAIAETVQVGFNPVEVAVDFIRDREIPITLKLIDSELFLVEDEDGWLQTELEFDEESEGGISVVVEKVVVDNATVIANPKGSAEASAADDVNADSSLDLPRDPQAEVAAAQDSIIKTVDEDGDPNVRLEPVVLQAVDAVATLRNDYQNIGFETSGEIKSGGDFDVEGEADLGTNRVNGLVRSSDVALSSVAALLPLPLAVEQGQLSSNVTIKYRGSASRSPLESLSFEGTAQVTDTIARLDAAPMPVEALNTRLRFQDQQIQLEDTSLRYGQIPLTATGSIDLRQGYDISAQVPAVTIADLQKTLNIPIPIDVAGEFQANADIVGPLTQPVVTGEVRSRDAIQVDRTAVESVEAAFRFTPPLLSVDSFTIVPSVGGQITGEGTVDLEADGGILASINAVLPGDALAQEYGFSLPQPYQIGNLNADLEVFGPFDDIQAMAQWRLPEATYTGQGELRYGDSQLRLQNAQFQVEGGTVNAGGVAQLDQNSWQANVAASGVQTSGVAPQLQGLLSADVALSGPLNNLDLGAIAAQGTAQLNEANIQPVSGLALVDSGTYQTGFRWTGNGLQVNDFRGPNLAADGFIGLDPAAAPVVTGFNLDVVANDYPLARLAPLLPAAVADQAQLRGRASYIGQVSGTLNAPQAAGQLQLDGFGVNRFTFADLAGPIQVGLGQGGTIALQGGGDRIAARLDDSYRPRDFLVRNGAATLQGETIGDRLSAQLRDFPLRQLAYRPLGEDIGAVQGVVNADIEANIADLGNPTAIASLAIAQPGLGPIRADKFTGNVAYSDDAVRLTNGAIALENSQYNLSGRLGLGESQPFDVALAAQQGQLETVVTALQFLAPGVGDLGAAGDAGQEALTSRDAGRPAQPLLEQLLYATKLAALNEQLEENRTAAVVPSLEELRGTFDASLTASGQVASGLDGLEARFALDGENWQWGQYDSPNQVEVAGRLENGTLALQPMRFESGDSVVAYSGTLGLGPQSGELRIEQVPMPLLQDIAAAFVSIPFELGGTLSAVTKLDGSLENPVIDGTVAIANAEIDGEPLEELAAEFRYADALFTAESRLVNQGPERIVAAARIPYGLPFMAVRPPSDQIAISAVVQDEGLALISAVTGDQLQWEGGDGIVRVDVGGTLDAPTVAGTAQFDGGTLAIAAIDDPFTDITGRAAFDLQQIRVAALTAQHNGGTVEIQGGLPLSEAAAGDPLELQVTLDQVPISLDVETTVDVAFDATVDGDVQVAGTALRPVLGGAIRLADGRVDPISGFVGGLGLLGGGNEEDKTAPVPDSVGEEAPPRRQVAGLEQFGRVIDQTTVADDGFASRIGFDDLKIILSDDLAIAGQPFFNIQAAGDFVVNGTLSALRPDGQLVLNSGWVNIYTTQFRLDRSETNLVILDPERGLDPLLIATATASVPETEQNPIPPSSPFMSSEVADQSTIPSFGGFETVEVTARIDGPLSQLRDSLDLESQPSRSDDQLIALIGGGLVNQLAQGDTALALASYVGSGTFASFSNDIVNTLGIDLFRIFPTTDVGDDSNLPISIGVEAGIDLTQDLSFTVLQLIGSTTPPQFGVRYRLTDDLQIRANTDLSEDTRGVLEYRIRF